MARTGKAAEDTQSILERLRRESFSSDTALEEMLRPSEKGKDPSLDDRDDVEDINKPVEPDEPDNPDSRTDAKSSDTAEKKTRKDKGGIEERTPPHGEAPPRPTAAEHLQDLLAVED